MQRAVQRGLSRRRQRILRRINVDEVSFKKRHEYATPINNATSSGSTTTLAASSSKSVCQKNKQPGSSRPSTRARTNASGTSSGPLHLDDDGVIPMKAARRICCDAGIVPMVEDAEGRVLDVGRKTRVISPALRRALNKRDDHSCRFPGCTHTRYLRGHHIVHWANGGHTKLDNLVLLCSHHHRLVHENGFGCAYVHGEMLFTTPDGAVLPKAVALPGLDQLGESAQTFEDDLAEFAIHKDTCLPNYHGDGMDYDMALQALAQLGQ
jgi:hypothetical protein